MKIQIFAAAILISLATNAASQNSGLWYHQYLEAETADQISTCNANFDFSNSWFSARLSGMRLDFIYYRDDFTLPYGQNLGTAIFRIDQVAFVVEAGTNSRRSDEPLNTAQILFFEPLTDDISDLINAFQAGGRFRIEFPNGSSYDFPLDGSRRAFAQAVDCWLNRPTGPFSNNPFLGSSGSNNPFETQ